jgi:uncharacterized protein (DUF58 family)
MSARAALEASAHQTVRATRDERAALYILVAIGAAVCAVLGGELRLFLLATPFAVIAIAGLVDRGAADVTMRVALDTSTCIEGDEISGRIDVDAPIGFDVEIAVMPTGDALTPVDDQVWAWVVPAGMQRPVGLPLPIAANRWGRHSAGHIEVRLIDPGSLLQRRGSIVAVPPITVLPSTHRLDQLLPPATARAVAGAHRTRRTAPDGYDFADIRDYEPGDRLRDLNWSATLRHDQPQVNRRHPERAGDVVVFVDSVPEGINRAPSDVGRELTVSTGRLAWKIARAHLDAGDRVGIAADGARTVWLPPATGRRTRYAIFDAIVRATSRFADHDTHMGRAESVHIPPAALVVAITPLARPRTLQTMASLRATGRAVAVIAVDLPALLRVHAPTLPDEIVRLQRLTFEHRVAGLRREALPVTVWTGRAEVDRLIAHL